MLVTSPLQTFIPKKMSPKEPLPIFLINRYFDPTMNCRPDDIVDVMSRPRFLQH